MAETDPQKWWMTRFQTQIVSQRKLTIVIHLLPSQSIQNESAIRFQMIVFK